MMQTMAAKVMEKVIIQREKESKIKAPKYGADVVT